ICDSRAGSRTVLRIDVALCRSLAIDDLELAHLFPQDLAAHLQMVGRVLPPPIVRIERFDDALAVGHVPFAARAVVLDFLELIAEFAQRDEHAIDRIEIPVAELPMDYPE